MEMQKVRISHIVYLLLFSALVIIVIPSHSFFVKWLASNTWEVVAMLRFYIGRCVGSYPDFLHYPLAHPLPSLFFYLGSKTFSWLPFWKQFGIVNFSMLVLSFYFLFATLSRTNDRITSLMLTLFFIMQVPIWGWSLSPFSYNIGLFLLTMGFYFFSADNLLSASLSFSLLPLVRHELSIIPFAVSLIIILSHTISPKRKTIYVAILLSPYILYYILASTLFYGNPIYLFLFHKYFYFGNQKSVYSIIREVSNPLNSLKLYNPFLWIGIPALLSSGTPTRTRLFALFISPLFIVGNISRIIIPLAFVSLMGMSNIGLPIKKRYTLLSLLLISQAILLNYIHPKPEGNEIVIEYTSRERTYETLSKLLTQDTYYMFPLTDYFTPVDDRSCRVIRRTLFSPEHFKPCTDIRNILLPDGRITHPPLNGTVLTTAQASIVNYAAFTHRLGRSYRIVTFIPEEKSVIIRCGQLKK